jgi:hypothetical protein
VEVQDGEHSFEGAVGVVEDESAQNGEEEVFYLG